MTGLRTVHVTSMPGDIGWPMQLPELAWSSGLTGYGSAGPDVNIPSSHCLSRKYCVLVRPMKRSIFSFVTELEPELSGTCGTLLWNNSLCGGETSFPSELRKYEKKVSRFLKLAADGSRGLKRGEVKATIEGTAATQM